MVRNGEPSLSVTVVGCAGSYPGPTSPASCYLVTATEPDSGRRTHVLLDLGNGALGALQRHLDLSQLDGVFISHLHPDHCLDLTGLCVVRRYDPGGLIRERLPVWGPRGTAERLAASYEGIGPEGMSREFDFRTLAHAGEVRVGPIRVTSFRVNHPVETYGLRVAVGRRVLSYTADTDSCEALTPLLAGADLVLADCAFVEGRDAVRGVHLTGRRAAEAAIRAGGVRRLMLTHLPAWNDPARCAADAAAIWQGAGVDGQPREVELAKPDATYGLA